ncbi:MAG: hypothetical protein CTY20_06875 [Hyphomicrobium sp.]|nr:MAG: hypothetical protein CTY20_06875 [Hyphomicrobium sp.]
MTKRPDFFNPISVPSKPARKLGRSAPADDWTPITPVPEDADEPDTRHHLYGKPSQVYLYTDEDGRPQMLVGRYDTGNGKSFIPYTFCRHADGTTAWRPKNIVGLRPLYNLHELKQRQDVLVLVVEGEKAADAASTLFPDYIVVTSSAGSSAGHLADWSPLRSRHVTFWRDNDKPGLKFQSAVVAALHAAGAASVRVVNVDPSWPDGFDLADFGDPDKLQPVGLTEQTIRQLVLDAEPVEPSAAASNVVALPGRSRERGEGAAMSFRKAQDGGLLSSTFREGKQDWRRVCSPITVVALTRSEEGKNWGVLVEVIDPDGNHHEFAIPQEALAGARSDEWRKLLARHGCMIEPGPEAGAAVHRYLMMTCDIEGKPLPRAIAATNIGWSGNIFVLPSGAISRDGSVRAVYQPTTRAETAIRPNGTSERWQQNVAVPSGEHDMTVLTISLALVSPLLQPLELQGFILHLRGGSSTGKTTALRVAGSVWGGGGQAGYLRSWQATANGLEAVAEAHNHTLLALDELGLLDADGASRVAYQLADGIGRQRAGLMGEAAANRNWRLAILSTGEISLEDKLREGRKPQRQRAGQAVRFVDLPADAGKGCGMFDTAPQIPDRPNATMQDRGAALSRRLCSATESDFGHLGPEFVRAIIHSADWSDVAKCIIDEFVASVSSGADGQVQRVARNFGLIAAAGELAIGFGLLPWNAGRAIKAAKAAFDRWLEVRGHSGAAEGNDAVSILRGVISKDASRFQKIDEPPPVVGADDEPPRDFVTGNRLGFREERGGKQYYLVPKEAWELIFAGHDPAGAAKKLQALGILAPSADGRPMIQRSLPGLGKKCRVYSIDAGRLFDDSIIGGAGDAVEFGARLGIGLEAAPDPARRAKLTPAADAKMRPPVR